MQPVSPTGETNEQGTGAGAEGPNLAPEKSAQAAQNTFSLPEPLEATCLTYEELMKIPADGGLSGLAKPTTTKTGQGKRSAEEMEMEDNIFLAERRAELKANGDFTKLGGDGLVELSKTRGKILNTLFARCATKLNSLKRRKDMAASATIHQVMRIQKTASIFSTVYAQLEQETPLGTTLKDRVTFLSSLGFPFGKEVHVKLVKALMLDALRFGKYDKLVGLL